MVVIVVLLLIVVAIVLGWFVVGLALKLLWWALIGLVIGALARLVLPGEQRIGLLATAGAGVAAALLGGVVADALDLGTILQFVVAVALAALFVSLLAGSDRFGRTRTL